MLIRIRIRISSRKKMWRIQPVPQHGWWPILTCDPIHTHIPHFLCVQRSPAPRWCPCPPTLCSRPASHVSRPRPPPPLGNGRSISSNSSYGTYLEDWATNLFKSREFLVGLKFYCKLQCCGPPGGPLIGSSSGNPPAPTPGSNTLFFRHLSRFTGSSQNMESSAPAPQGWKIVNHLRK